MMSRVSSNRHASTACPTCGGEGVICEPSGPGLLDLVEAECPACHGSGWVYIQRVCPCGKWRTMCQCNLQNKPFERDEYGRR